jgi:hypothetical protein
MKQRKLNFRYNIGDAILLSDGRRGIITRYGIYDDQYWCEIADAHGINLCFADWFFARGCAPTIMQRLPSKDAVSLAQQLKSATEENDRRFGSNSVSDRYGPIAHLYS